MEGVTVNGASDGGAASCVSTTPGVGASQDAGAAAVLAIGAAPGGAAPGAWTPKRQADDKAQTILNEIKSTIESKANKKFKQFQAIQIKTKKFCGTEFLLKVQVSSDEYIHVQLYESENGKVRMRDFRLNMSKTASLEVIDLKNENENKKWNGPTVADEKAQLIAENVCKVLESKLEINFEMFRAVAMNKQIHCDGTNWLMKVQVSNTGYVHIRVFEPLSSDASELVGYQLNKCEESSLEMIPKMSEVAIPEEWCQECPADQKAQEVADSVRITLEQETNQTFKMYTAVLHRNKTSNDISWLIKVQCTDTKYIHMQVSEQNSKDGCCQLKSFKLNMPKAAPLEILADDGAVQEMKSLSLFGHWSPECTADKDVQRLADSVRDFLEIETNQKFGKYKAVVYRTDLMVNWLIKVEVEPEDFIHIQIHAALSGQESTCVTGYKLDTSRNSSLVLLTETDPTSDHDGWSCQSTASKEGQRLIDSIRSIFELESNQAFNVYEAVAERVQLVTGTNWLVKIKVSSDQYAHVQLYEQSPCYGGDVQLVAYRLDLSKNVPLEVILTDNLLYGYLVGRWSRERAASQRAQQVADQVQKLLEYDTNTSFSKYTAVRYRFQVVAGTNWLIKVQVSADKFIHLQVLEPVAGYGNVELQGYKLNVCKGSPLKPVMPSHRRSTFAIAYKDEVEADDMIQETAEKVRSVVENETQQKFDMYKAVAYKSGVLTASLLLIKVQISADLFVHLQVLQEKTDGPTKLIDFRADMTREAPFEADEVHMMPNKTLSVSLIGGWSCESTPGKRAQIVANILQQSLEAETNRSFEEFKVVIQKTQCVAGTNWLLKVKISQNEYAHLLIFDPLPHQGQVELLGYRMEMSEDSFLIPFEKFDAPFSSSWMVDQPANQRCQNIAESVRSTVELEINQTFSLYKAVQCSSRVTDSGDIIWLIKVQVSEDEYIHILLIEPLSSRSPPELQGYRRSMTKDCPLGLLMLPDKAWANDNLKYGGWSYEQTANQRAQDVADMVRECFEKEVNKSFSEYCAVIQRTSVDMGTKWLIKVQVSKDRYVHLHVIEHLPYLGGVELMGYKLNMSKESPLKTVPDGPDRPLRGGWSRVCPATEHTQDITNIVRGVVESAVSKKFSQFTAISYRKRHVAGTNWIIKVQVSVDKYVHVRVFEPLPNQGEVRVEAYRLNQSRDSPLEFFDSTLPVWHPRLGCWSDEGPANEYAQEVAQLIRKDLESETNQTFAQYQAVVCRTQVVAGTNWFIKVQVSGDSFVHICVFEPLSHTGNVELKGYRLNMSKNSPLDAAMVLSRYAMWGGWTKECPAGQRAQDVANVVRDSLESDVNQNQKFEVYKAISCISQRVNGINWLIKIQISADVFVHLSVFEGICSPAKLTGYKMNLTKDEPLQDDQTCALSSAQVVGAWSHEENAESLAQEVIDKVRDTLQSNCNQVFEKFIAVRQRLQVVTGFKWLVKVQVSSDMYVHLCIHQSLQGDAVLRGYKLNMCKLAPLEMMHLYIPVVPGGWTRETPADDQAQDVIKMIRGSLQTSVNQVFEQFTAVSYRSHVEGWKNFLVKVQVSADKYVHVQVFEPLHYDGEVQLEAYRMNMTKDAPLIVLPKRIYSLPREAWTNECEAEERAQSLAVLICPVLEKETKKRFGEFCAVAQRIQIIDGTNWLIKVRTGSHGYIHMQLFEPLPGQGDVQLFAYRLNKSDKAPLETMFASMDASLPSNGNGLSTWSPECAASDYSQKIFSQYCTDYNDDRTIGQEITLVKDNVALQRTQHDGTGTNWLLKAEVNPKEYLHMHLFEPLPGQGDPELKSYRQNMSRDSPLQLKASLSDRFVPADWTPEESVSSQAHFVAEKAHAALVTITKQTFELYEAVLQRSKLLVAGTNWLIKVKVSSNKYAHLQIYEPLPLHGNVHLESFRLNMLRESPLEPMKCDIANCNMSSLPVLPEWSHKTAASIIAQAAAEKVRPTLESETEQTYEEYTAVKERSQLVNGTNWLIKMQTGKDRYLHLQLFEPLPGQGDVKLLSYSLDMSESDPLELHEVNCLNSVSKYGYGSWTLEMPCSRSAQIQANNIRQVLELETNQSFVVYEATLQRTQRVAGTNWLIKIRVGKKVYAHVQLFEPLPGQGETRVISYMMNLLKDSPLEVIPENFSMAATEINPLGGWSSELPANLCTHEIAGFIRDSLESEMNRKFTLYRSISYRFQRLHGGNQIIKIQIDQNVYIAARVFVPLRGTGEIKLTGYKKLKNDESLTRIEKNVGGSKLLGEWGDVKEPKGHALDVAEMIHQLIKQNIPEYKYKEFMMFEPVKFRTQEVNGTNYLFEFQVNTDSYIHVLAYKPLPGQGDMTLTGYKLEAIYKKDSLDLFDYTEPDKKTDTVGGWSKECVAFAKIQKLANLVRKSFESAVNQSFDFYKVVVYRTQVVVGSNWLIKVQVGRYEYAHIQVYEPLPGHGNVQILHQKLGKSRSQLLEIPSFNKATPEQLPLGSWTEEETASPHCQKIVESVSVALLSMIEENLERFDRFKAKKMRRQTVSGTNWLIKIEIAANQYIHIQVCEPLYGEKSKLISYKPNMKQHDPLEVLANKMVPINMAVPYGKWTDDRLADDQVQILADTVRKDLEEKMDKSLGDFQAVVYKAKLTRVGGTNYMIKVQTNSESYVHIMVNLYEPVPQVPSVKLMDYEPNQTRTSALIF